MKGHKKVIKIISSSNNGWRSRICEIQVYMTFETFWMKILIMNKNIAMMYLERKHFGDQILKTYNRRLAQYFYITTD